ncbi:MAG: hypothetical protein B6D64_01645 [Bacteroidetes bacterium 4484_276]|nr:MAG: hypothetical protein B6D64_01645 [Bacteroidetes bacterium 4484_276]
MQSFPPSLRYGGQAGFKFKVSGSKFGYPRNDGQTEEKLPLNLSVWTDKFSGKKCLIRPDSQIQISKSKTLR